MILSFCVDRYLRKPDLGNIAQSQDFSLKIFYQRHCPFCKKPRVRFFFHKKAKVAGAV